MLSLFEGFGLETEYMIVDKQSLQIQSIADKVIYDLKGAFEREVDLGETKISNDIGLHMLEIKTNGPKNNLENVHKSFQATAEKVNAILSKYNARLLPTGMHPFMKPAQEAVLWPHENREI